MSGKMGVVESVLTKTEIAAKVYGLLGIWLESLLYGGYLYLFVSSVNVHLRKKAPGTSSSRVFFAGILAMFTLISIHNGLNIYRLIISFGYQTDIREPAVYLTNFSNWENRTLPVLLALTLWIGDSLVAYRCLIIWEGNYWITSMPLIFFLTTTTIQAVNIWATLAFKTLRDVPPVFKPLVKTLFPLYVTLNVLTTTLVVIKIWLRYRDTKNAGVAPLHTPNLVLVMRIVVESAALHTIGLLIAIVLLQLRHPGRLLFLNLLEPLIGIAFVLLLVRAHSVGEEAKDTLESPSLMPTWLVHESKP